MKVIQFLLIGYLIASSASQDKTPEGDVATRSFPGPGGVGGFHSGIGPEGIGGGFPSDVGPEGVGGFHSGVGPVGNHGSFGQGVSSFGGSGRPQRPFGGGVSSGFGHGGRPLGGVSSGFGQGGRPTIGGAHGSFGERPPIGDGIDGGLISKPPIGEGGRFPGGSHVGGSKTNCRYWCNQERGKVYCCEYDTDPLRPVGEKLGKCPPVRTTCPGTKFGPDRCSNDFSCGGIYKCCFDKCLNIAVCKKPIDFIFPDLGFPTPGTGVDPHNSGISGSLNRPGIGSGFPGSGLGGGIHRPITSGVAQRPGIGGGFPGPGIGGSHQGSGIGGGIHRPGIGGVSHGSVGGGFHQGSGLGGGVRPGAGNFEHVGSFARKKNN